MVWQVRTRHIPRSYISSLRLLFIVGVVLFLIYSFIRALGTTSPQSEDVTTRTALTAHPETAKAWRSRFAVTTFTTKQDSYTFLAIKNKNEYARKHDYGFILDTSAPQVWDKAGIWWHKFVMLKREAMKHEYEWLWWSDFDSLVTNATIKLDTVIDDALSRTSHPDAVDFVLNDDCNRLNSGSMFMRTTASAIATIEELMIYGAANVDLSEQSSLRDILYKPENMVYTPKNLARLSTEEREAHERHIEHVGGRENFRPRLIMMEQYRMNAFPEEIKCYDAEGNAGAWRYGDLLLHFAGAWAHLPDKTPDPYGIMMFRYESKIIW